MTDLEIISKFPTLMNDYVSRDPQTQRTYRDELISMRKLLPEDHPLPARSLPQNLFPPPQKWGCCFFIQADTTTISQPDARKDIQRVGGQLATVPSPPFD